ncbi:MAG: chromosome segregation protein SMC [Ktedonobacteraceae bacterium]
MYLKRLEMLGFKSFATRTLLEFSPGITAVIGPNGAGKSNVADAMRWVLGEQSMRQLRGKKSDDIIFAGASGRSALGMAEVSLTLDNSTGWVPSDYSEITVTRRSFRSGENEYLINKQKVRLKDVLLLLAQARIGHDSYTVVGQGSIDAALSLRAEERRGLFEDAAGIRPFQVQRADAENRLRQTEQNLERLRDIVNEIEPRLAPLAEQARRAVEYIQLNNEMQEVLSTWYALQWRRLHSLKEHAEQAEQEQASRVRHLEQSIHELQEQGNTLRAKRQQTQTRIHATRQSYNEANSSMQRSERDLAISQERIVSLERQREDIQQEERRLRERAIAAQKKTLDLEEQCDAADEAVDNEAAALATLEVQVSKAQKEYELDERRLRTAQNDLIQIQARLGSSQSDLGRVQKQLGERNRTLAARRDTIAQAQQSLRTIETRLVEERAHLSTVRSEEQQVTQRKQALARAFADAQQEVERLKAMLAEAERHKRTVTDRLNMLKNWRQSLSGYGDGVRSLLRAPAGKVTGVLGPVPQLGVAPSGMEVALETAFGPYMQAVVVKNLDDAYRALEFLQSAGKAMVVWLEQEDDDGDAAVLSIQDQEEEAALQRFIAEKPMLQNAVLGFAWRHIHCEAHYTTLFRRILRGIVIARTGEAAQALLSWALPLSLSSGNDLPFTAIITLQGEMLHVDGWLTSRGKDNGQQGLLAYERELRELPLQVEQQKTSIDQRNNMLSEVQRAQEGRRIEQNASEKELQKLMGRINELQKIVNASQRELERTNTEIQLAASVEQQLAAEVSGLEQEVVSAQQRMKAHEKSQRELAGRVEELQYEMEERAMVYRSQQDEVGRARTNVAVKRQEAKALQQQVALQRAQAQELKSMIEQQVARRKDAERRQQVLQETITLQSLEQEKARTQVHTLNEALQAVEGELIQVDQDIAASEQQRVQVQQHMTDQEIHYRRSLLESQRARDAVTTLVEQLREEMGIDDLQKLDTYVSHTVATAENDEAAMKGNGVLSEEEETQLRRLRKRVDALRSRLKVMGGYDSNAPQLYEETRTRFEFLSTQIVDMEQAALQLHTIISQLDVTMARQFEITFQAINVRFREHFTTLFSGGMARLELVTAKTDEEDHSTPSGMPAGVDVIVQPPGKKVQDLSLLSGGERALVSAALLFALLEINPPPFCLLDEVDAALDETNVTRFCDILKRLAQRTQFIVITHNRVTMTVAQVLYGVSMRESISRLLSMRIEEAVVAGDR